MAYLKLERGIVLFFLGVCGVGWGGGGGDSFIFNITEFRDFLKLLSFVAFRIKSLSLQ